ncbi:MAG: FAD binding domain-containing protein [Candidatus Omnitrophica bacterium]|nr:FAD binding domain-containing protein [Candidatus Omnitrophota bacterium]MDE2214478.1 FAD binding domain-containing protein [Candidatus Omnitrophota bacterium]MDE2231618.1 FAD binding domain-containing protein [Candidatus Omnitrophota bacterium]
MLLNPLTLHLPETRLEAARLYKELEDSRVLAGGTFLLNSMKLLKTKGTRTARNILSLAKVDELKGLDFQDGTLTIRAMTRIDELLSSPLPQGHVRVLHTVCRNISTNPIRNMATVGGNLTCRYTWTEMGSVMIALDAGMHFLGPDGKEDVIAAEDFFKNGARCEKLFTHVTIKTCPRSRSAYRRVKKTVHVDVPLLAVCVKTDLNGKQWYNTRVGINNGTAFAQRDRTLEEFLNKSRSSPQLGAEALEHLTGIIYDTRASEYKQHMFRVSLRSAIEEISMSS